MSLILNAMQKLTILLLMCVLACQAEAKGKKYETFISFQKSALFNVGFNPKTPICKSLGIPSFSYSSSLEQRFSLHTNLKFSLQYSLTYFNMNMQQLQQTIARNLKTNELTAGVGVQAIYQFRKDACVVTGFTMNKPVYSCFKADVPNEAGKWSSLSQQKFSLQDSRSWNPMFNIGFEKQFTLFNRDMRYSIQYNFGYSTSRNPYLYSYPAQRGSYLHGISIGVKYKL